MSVEAQIEGKLQQLRLTGKRETLAMRVKQAEESNSGYLDFLWTLLDDEYDKRQSKSLLIRLKKAGFEEEKTLEGFDFAFNPHRPRRGHRALHRANDLRDQPLTSVRTQRVERESSRKRLPAPTAR